MPDPTAAPRTPNLLTLGVLVIALAAVFLTGFQVRNDDPGTLALSAAAPATDTQPTGVVTGGNGKAEGTPDQLRFTATVTNQRTTSEEAVAATNHDVRAVTINLKKNGVEDKDIQTASVSIDVKKAPRSAGGGVAGYTSTQRVTVLVRDLTKAGKTLGSVTAAAGNAVRISGITLSLSDQDAVIAQAREEAVTKSKEAAEALAKAAGREVGELVYVEEVVPQSYGRLDAFSRALTAAVSEKSIRQGSVPISPGQLSFTVTVKVRWSLA